ncbi:MAG: type I restriction endonuclease subunit S [Methylomonas sp.]|nr:MAG: type I restriction endonuclease subunit S [Methylomonas sp.]
MAGKYQAYPEYKDSGVEWIGEIPSDWDMWKIAHACPYIASGTTPTSDSDKYYGGEYLWVTTGELRENIIFDTQKKVTGKALVDMPTLRLHPKGSVSIAMYGATIGRLGIFGKEATTNQACCVMPPSKVLHNKYLFYWLYATRNEIINLSSGGGQPNVNQEKIASLKISAPHYELQIKIVNFLDHETAKIDTLIEKQQQLIQLLKEKRQAVISHAVTKGLNPDVPMRDSGVEWLGEVPAHWEVKRIKHFGKIIGGYAFKSNDFCDSGIKAIKISNVSHLFFEWSDSSFLPENFLFEKREYVPPKDSLIFAMTRPIISGGVKVAKFDLDEECLVNQRVGFLKPSHKINQDYLMYVAQSNSFFCAFDNNITATNQPNISSEGIEDIRFSCPNLSEQAEIVGYISAISKLFENTLNKVNEQIELMQERRTALISAAVTGKIDVRNWVAPAHP